MIADIWETKCSSLTIVSSFACIMFILPFAAHLPFYLFMVAVMVWSALS
ncbi:hypothetical protein LQV63_18160 [Paenibacillus profundus]|uniref:Uncharacterized protein n=1 Tax=Paenibacillus profundus TaxID=1173085 RepID=A0ABS8YI20_9BACL|nr:hypothetical protein [Paenibacillus profundus]MCE5171227.1 hypothetical protein [Paenibacillus profundus]